MRTAPYSRRIACAFQKDSVKRLWAVRTLERLHDGNYGNYRNNAYRDWHEVRMASRQRSFASILRGSDRATSVGVILVIVRIFGRNRGVVRIDRMLGDHAVGVIVLHGTFLVAGDHVHLPGLRGNFQLAGIFQADLSGDGARGIGNDADIAGVDLEIFRAIVRDEDGAAAEFGDGSGLPRIESDAAIAEKFVDGLADADSDVAVRIRIENVAQVNGSAGAGGGCSDVPILRFQDDAERFILRGLRGSEGEQ